NYTVTDGTATANSTLTITILDSKDAAEAEPDTNWTEEGAGTIAGNVLQTIAHPGDPSPVLSFSDHADTDPDADPLTVTTTGNRGGTYGTLTLNADGSYSYALNNALAAVQGLDTGETLIETYNYTVTDGTATANATLTITIFGTNDAPVAVPDTNWAQEDVANACGNVLQTLAHPGDPSPVLSFSDQADTDVDVEALTVTTTGNRGGTYGTLTLNADGSYSYVLNNGNAAVQGLDTGETLIETYNYTVTDGDATASSTLTITIFGTNDAPVAVPDTNWTEEGAGPIAGNVLQTIAHPGDPSPVLSFSDQADTDLDA